MKNPTYEEVVSSRAFREDLDQLNNAIADGLRRAGEPIAINGNVCYGHMQQDFHLGDMEPVMEPKRRALHQASQDASCFVEVGVAGGHAALLALHSNPSLKFIGIDLGQRLKPFWPPVDVYVPIVFKWLEDRFPERVKLYLSQAIDGLQQAAAERPFGPIDLLHLDAMKNSRIAELEAAWPGLAGRCYLLQGDNKNGHVQASSETLIADGRARAITSSRYRDIHSTNYELLEIGPDVAAGKVSLDSLKDDRILLCVCHQDDETLFCGSTLSRLKDRADVTIVSFFRPAPNRRDTDTREAAMQRVCDRVGARRIQFPFAQERDHRMLRRFIQMPPDSSQGHPEVLRPLHRHPLFNLLSGSAFALMEQLKPSTIITHNHVGEYGHIEHVLLHHAVLQAAQRYQGGRLLSFGEGLANADLVVPSWPEQKNRLFDEYMPQWNGRQRYDFALADETFVKLDTSVVED
ncbi:PIG-L family deacetylase [Rhodobacteraceae bacterium B1Z28]|uniref:PIG-L family deacetylase n=1 Tax=Ruegeria haliotis TaxID=2747601 RepID=A0ABX2PM63_9RHOB|nr:PIG-L family deacetylase [Ruegeria haliotis]NVO54796.1 PIG-L family deacetylase [Ruegeria haliotis]